MKLGRSLGNTSLQFCRPCKQGNRPWTTKLCLSSEATPVVPELLASIQPHRSTVDPKTKTRISTLPPSPFCGLEFNPAPVVGDWDCQLASHLHLLLMFAPCSLTSSCQGPRSIHPLLVFLVIISLLLLGNLPFLKGSVRCLFCLVKFWSRFCSVA